MNLGTITHGKNASAAPSSSKSDNPFGTGIEQLEALTMDLKRKNEDGSTFIREELGKHILSNGRGGRFDLVLLYTEQTVDKYGRAGQIRYKLRYKKCRLYKSGKNKGKLYAKYDMPFTVNELQAMVGIIASIQGDDADRWQLVQIVKRHMTNSTDNQ